MIRTKVNIEETFSKIKRKLFHEDVAATPFPRSGHRMCADSNFLYVFGGFNPNHPGKTFNELWRYNTSSGVWLLMPDEQKLAPKSSLSSSMVLLDNCIFVFGGTGYPFSLTNSNRLFMYSLTLQRWYNLNEMTTRRDLQRYPIDHTETKSCGCQDSYDKLPVPKYGQSMVMSEDHKLFVYSGTTGHHFTNELHSFCLRSLHWTEHQLCGRHYCNKSFPRYRHEIALYEKEFYLFGGATSDDRLFSFENIISFHCTNREWREQKCTSKTNKEENVMAFPDRRKAHSCVTWDGKVYMIGGLSQEKENLDDCWIFDLETKTWEQSEKKVIPEPLRFHSSTVTPDGCMYVFGGVTESDRRVNDLHKMWLTIPPLKRLAWMQLLRSLKTTGNFNEETLKTLKVPREFLECLDQLDSCDV